MTTIVAGLSRRRTRVIRRNCVNLQAQTDAAGKENGPMLRPLLYRLERRVLLASSIPATPADARPDAWNTGPTGPLQVISNDLEITVDGTVLRDVDVQGSIRVK